MPFVTVLFDYLFARRIVVSGVQAKMLRLFFGWFRTLNDDRFNRLLQQEMIIDIGWRNDNGEWSALSINKQALLRPGFRAICRVGANFITADGRPQAECLWMTALVSRNSLKATSPHSRPFPDIL
jgi:hypothetical protein